MKARIEKDRLFLKLFNQRLGVKNYIKMINANLSKKGYDTSQDWKDLEGYNFQDNAFIAAAVLVKETIKNDFKEA